MKVSKFNLKFWSSTYFQVIFASQIGGKGFFGLWPSLNYCQKNYQRCPIAMVLWAQAWNSDVLYRKTFNRGQKIAQLENKKSMENL